MTHVAPQYFVYKKLSKITVSLPLKTPVMCQHVARYDYNKVEYYWLFLKNENWTNFTICLSF